MGQYFASKETPILGVENGGGGVGPAAVTQKFRRPRVEKGQKTITRRPTRNHWLAESVIRRNARTAKKGGKIVEKESWDFVVAGEWVKGGDCDIVNIGSKVSMYQSG